MKEPEMTALTVKKMPKETLQRFSAACHLDGKKMNEVIRQFMEDYAEEKLGKRGKA